jgi:hypothetical protein
MPPKSVKITMSDTKDKPVDGDGMLDMESLLPNLPRKVQNLYKKVKNDRVTELEIFRRPVGRAIEKALDAFSGNAVEKFFKNTNYDKLFISVLLLTRNICSINKRILNYLPFQVDTQNS